VQTLKPIVFGCAHAFSRQLIRRFGPLRENVIHEDNVLAFRSILAGQLFYINKPLVKYRLHGSNVYVRTNESICDLSKLKEEEDWLRRRFKNRETMYEAFLADLEKAKVEQLIGAAEAAKVAQEASRRRQHAWLIGRFLESGLLARWPILWRLRREGLNQDESRLLVRRLLPRPILLWMRLARSYTSLAWSRSA
jgi:hypothetical protein